VVVKASSQDTLDSNPSALAVFQVCTSSDLYNLPTFYHYSMASLQLGRV